MKKLLVVAAVMSLASVASADLMLEITDNGSPQAGLNSYTLTFKAATPGDKFSAFDGRFTGVMSQTWYNFKGWLTTVWVGDFSLPGEAATAAVDSHLLIDPNDPSHVLIASGANEDFDDAAIIETTVDGYDRALGTYLSTTATSNMAFAVPVAYQKTIQPFAQIVIPDGEIVHLTATAVAYNGQGLVLDLDIPEPATLGLLAFGAAGALIRRRRR